MKLIIAGGRSFEGDEEHLQWLDDIDNLHKVTEVISGKAPGADYFGEQWAKLRRLPVKAFPAKWHRHGRAAGPMRNRQMAEYADAVALFPGGKGTDNMRYQARFYGLKIFEYPTPTPESNDEHV